MPRLYRARNLFTFKCTGCGREKACTFKRSKAKTGLCRICRTNKVDERQLSIFASRSAL